MSMRFLTYVENSTILSIYQKATIRRKGAAMARGKKNRCVCNFPENQAFAPVGGRKKEAVVLSIDEYETIRLIDREGLSQEQCAEQMEVSRTTVQAIYAAARKKLVDFCVKVIRTGKRQIMRERIISGTDTDVINGCRRSKNMNLHITESETSEWIYKGIAACVSDVGSTEVAAADVSAYPHIFQMFPPPDENLRIGRDIDVQRKESCVFTSGINNCVDAIPFSTEIKGDSILIR